jgi:short-subunit dehydrogenase
MIKDLRGCNAIVTGASRGLGVPIALALADEGVNVTLAARSASGLDKVRAAVEERGARAVSVPTDVSDFDQLDALVESAEREIGPTDILVNNAGIEGTYPYEEYPPDEIVQLIAVNLTAPLLLTRKVLPGMLERGRGHIVQVASLAGKAGFPLQGPYAASKAALIQFTHSLRAELVDSPVDCSAVCPGFVSDEGMYADMARETGVQASKLLGESSPDRVAKAVIKAIKRGSSELLVNPAPMRPIVVLGQVFPDVVPRVLKTFGVTKLARRVASIQKGAAHSSGRDPEGTDG